ncbi:DUF6519 domain-containing protein [Sphingomonas nostoxanthinifaciens]|uniref:DUF6519 domain-containing protein n=1 Tax=Sphingomonas nostoxanthinifaciens TaxID=2872652 RepID=UPI001CC2090F|nr:DUF6519 domain-containing protein [Sphingomonas nostoxanthinifaciens]UAK23284.1 DUF6519 domain-containing protein [Sphingomonas nostoxanthinifaciens]
MTIRNDSSRPAARLSGGRRPRSVVARQGQVLLDVDLNEEAASAAERIEIEALDMLGSPAVPFHAAGFKIGAGGTISVGRLYLDGLLVENLAPCTLDTQPHPADPIPTAGGLVTLKAVVRLVDPVEDRALADKALADAAASGRGYVDWQVFAMPLTLSASGAPPACGDDLPDWDKLVAPSSGRLAARVDPGTAATNFCSPAAAGGYMRLENLHYRVEVDGGTAVAGYPTVDGARYGLDGLRLKFSRRNASVMVRITGYTGRALTVDPPVLDAGNWFAPGSGAEIVSIDDDVDPTQAEAQTRLFKVAQVSSDTITLDGDPTALPPTATLGTDWYLRLWEPLPDFSVVAAAVPDGASASKEIDLGDGVRVTLRTAVAGDTLYRRGDYWSFTARVDGTIDWPEDSPGVPTPRMPDGPAIHYARLAIAPSASADPTDCRPIILPLTEQIELLYAGGDGQSAFLGDTPTASGFIPLRAPLRVLVLRGGLPLPGVTVTWANDASVTLDGSGAATDAQGLVAVMAALDPAKAADLFSVTASLTPPAGVPPVAPIMFSAGFATAARTSYDPGCDLLADTSTVQDALDTLCANINGVPDALQLTRIAMSGASGVTELLADGVIANGIELDPEAFLRGLIFTVDRGPLRVQPQPFDPIVDIELELPYPTTRTELTDWQNMMDANPAPFGTQRLRLLGTVTVKEHEIVWTPSQQAEAFLHLWQRHMFGAGEKTLMELEKRAMRVLGRIRLRSQFVWIEVADTPLSPIETKLTKREQAALVLKRRKRIYLNAEYLGGVTSGNGRALLIGESDPQRAGDLDMFFYFVPPPEKPVTAEPIKVADPTGGKP